MELTSHSQKYVSMYVGAALYIKARTNLIKILHLHVGINFLSCTVLFLILAVACSYLHCTS